MTHVHQHILFGMAFMNMFNRRVGGEVARRFVAAATALRAGGLPEAALLDPRAVFEAGSALDDDVDENTKCWLWIHYYILHASNNFAVCHHAAMIDRYFILATSFRPVS